MTRGSPAPRPRFPTRLTLLVALGLALGLGAAAQAPTAWAQGQEIHPAPAQGEQAAPAKGEGHADEGHSEGHGGGGHGEHHGLDPTRLAFQLINFGILVFLLGFFGGRAINKALAARHEQIKKDIDEAAQIRQAAEGRLVHQEKRLANLEKEVASLRASIQDEARKEEQRLLAAAEEKAVRLQEETRFLMSQQVKEAELRFRAEVASRAAQVAEELVRRSLRPDDEARLRQTFIADLAGDGAGGSTLPGSTPGSSGSGPATTNQRPQV